MSPTYAAPPPLDRCAPYEHNLLQAGGLNKLRTVPRRPRTRGQGNLAKLNGYGLW